MRHYSIFDRKYDDIPNMAVVRHKYFDRLEPEYQSILTTYYGPPSGEAYDPTTINDINKTAAFYTRRVSEAERLIFQGLKRLKTMEIGYREGYDLGEDGMELAYEACKGELLELMREALMKCAQELYEITSDDVWDRMPDWCRGTSKGEKSSLGYIFLEFAKAEIIMRVFNKTKPSRSPPAHRQEKRVWISLLPDTRQQSQSNELPQQTTT